MKSLIKSGHVLDSNSFPCSDAFSLSDNDDEAEASVLYIQMADAKDTKTWLHVAKCLRIWDLDARGSHKGMWRMNFKGIPLFVVGVPFSDYS